MTSEIIPINLLEYITTLSKKIVESAVIGEDNKETEDCIWYLAQIKQVLDNNTNFTSIDISDLRQLFTEKLRKNVQSTKAYINTVLLSLNLVQELERESLDINSISAFHIVTLEKYCENITESMRIANEFIYETADILSSQKSSQDIGNALYMLGDGITDSPITEKLLLLRSFAANAMQNYRNKDPRFTGDDIKEALERGYREGWNQRGKHENKAEERASEWIQGLDIE